MEIQHLQQIGLTLPWQIGNVPADACGSSGQQKSSLTTGQGDRFFVLKSRSRDSIDTSRSKGIWALRCHSTCSESEQPHQRLASAAKVGRAVLLFADSSEHAWVGYAEVTGEAAHDAGVPGTSVPDGLKKTTGPDDGNPKGWDRKRRCDQDGLPRCQICEGVGGRAWSDKNEDIDIVPCEVVAKHEDMDPETLKTVAPPLYPKKFTVKRKDGKQGGYSDTLIGWKTDPFCFGFFPQNDSIKPLCYRSEDSLVKYYDIEREATRIDYTIHNEGIFGIFPNITSTILMVQDQMWIQNHLWVIDQCICANPSGNHCENPPCKSYIHRWNTFETAQHLGREKIKVEWIDHHGSGNYGKEMELDHFILWTHHVWTDPVSKKIVRAWKPFNGLQVYDPEAWVEDIEDPSVFEAPPAKCKKGGAKVRINCDDDGNYHPKKSEGLEHLDTLFELAVLKGPAALEDFAKQLYAAHEDHIVV